MRRQGQVIVTDDGNVLRYALAGGGDGPDGAHRYHIGGADDAVELLTLRQNGGHGLECLISRHMCGNVAFWGRAARCTGERLAVAFVAQTQFGNFGIAEKYELTAPQRQQMLGCKPRPSDIVGTDRAIGLPLDLPTPNHKRLIVFRDRLERLVLGTLADDDDAVRPLRGNQVGQPVFHRRHDLLQEQAIATLGDHVRQIADHLHEKGISQRLGDFVTERKHNADRLRALQAQTARGRIHDVAVAACDAQDFLAHAFFDQRTTGQGT